MFREGGVSCSSVLKLAKKQLLLSSVSLSKECEECLGGGGGTGKKILLLADVHQESKKKHSIKKQHPIFQEAGKMPRKLGLFFPTFLSWTCITVDRESDRSKPTAASSLWWNALKGLTNLMVN